jgi:hypothetical protein
MLNVTVSRIEKGHYKVSFELGRERLFIVGEGHSVLKSLKQHHAAKTCVKKSAIHLAIRQVHEYIKEDRE